MSPSNNAKAQYALSLTRAYDVSGLAIGEEVTETYRGVPLMIRRVAEEEFLVLELRLLFSGPKRYGCQLHWPYVSDNEYIPAETYFREYCRGVSYDRDGQVLAGSHPCALPLTSVP